MVATFAGTRVGTSQLLAVRCFFSIFDLARTSRAGVRAGLLWAGVLFYPEARAEQSQATAPTQAMFIRQFRVVGAHEVPQGEVDEAIYPFLGPGRTVGDIEQARVALEKAYQSKGFQAASVQVPVQSGRRGIIVLEVHEGKVGQIRVRGSRYFLPSAIKAQARSVAEGRAINFNDLTRDVVGLNQWPDRQVKPSMTPGAVPGTVDVALTVEDKLPLHGSFELNNRSSPDTTELRINGGLSYTNLWQAGHTMGGNFQLSPQNWSEVKVYSGYYIARFPSLDGFSLMLQGTKQNSNVSTLGGAASAGRGEVVGIRGVFTLPSEPEFYQSINVGLDYKHFTQELLIGQTRIATPITYYPISANYSATWAKKKSTTELNLGVNFSFRGLGSDSVEFEETRFGADGSFIFVRGDFSHSRDLPGGLQAYAKVQGQISDQPLVNSEQFSGGGLGTVRGYLEAEALGDNAILGSLELRSPSLSGLWPRAIQDWRIYAFGDAGALTLHEPLPEQDSSFRLASVGVGTRWELFNHFNGSVDLAWPLVSEIHTQSGDVRLTFRVSADF